MQAARMKLISGLTVIQGVAQMKVISQLTMGLLGVIVAMGAVGCETKPSMGEFNVTVSLAPGYDPSGSLEVDLVGVPDNKDKRSQNERC